MKKNNSTALLIVLAVMAIGLAYVAYFRPFDNFFLSRVVSSPTPEPFTLPSPEPLLSVEEETLQGLSGREKIAQLIAAPLVVGEEEEAEGLSMTDLITRENFGVVTLFGSEVGTDSAWLAVESVASSELGLQLQPLVAVDHEGGTVQRLSGEGFTRLPSWQEVCALSVADKKELLAAAAAEIRSAGVDIVFAPMVDIAVNHPVLKSRVCSGDVDTVIDNASLFVTTFQAASIMPVIKHFPGIGETTRDTHHAFDVVEVTADTAGMYASLLGENANIGVMTAHVGIEKHDPDVPCSLSPVCTGELRREYPQALIVTDSLDMAAAAYSVTGEEKDLGVISQQAVLAGNDVLIYGNTEASELEAVLDFLTESYETSDSFRERVDESVLKIITLKNSSY